MDRLSQSSVETSVCSDLLDRYQRWISYEWIYAEVLLWSSLNRHRYDDPERQMRAMYDAVALACEHEKANRTGYEVDDVFWYSVPHLKELVAQVVAGVNSTRLDPAYADVQNGIFKLISETSKGIILEYHLEGMTDDGGYDHAIAELQKVLGGQRPRGL